MRAGKRWFCLEKRGTAPHLSQHRVRLPGWEPTPDYVGSLLRPYASSRMPSCRQRTTGTPQRRHRKSPRCWTGSLGIAWHAAATPPLHRCGTARKPRSSTGVSRTSSIHRGHTASTPRRHRPQAKINLDGGPSELCATPQAHRQRTVLEHCRYAADV